MKDFSTWARIQILRSARYALAHSNARYKLGAGGFDPKSRLPENSKGECDCSGFASWLIGLSRKITDALYAKLNGGWIETSAIVRDGETAGGIFTRVDVPEPGVFFVWGDRGAGQGHIGVVTEVENGRATKVAHCSSGNDRIRGRAIAETAADMFYRMGGIFVRFDGVA